ncbi:gamma-glutamyltransferase [Ponticaulis sp.]|uniref:gamma-glutamyltransferase n=1 Tax=Ponticaulis sp. TaxID=2020902 RepID=UPI000B6F2585|nr:gamma-glutamyltransferase [Ponticaulis sp.]MAI91590.1 gamma-glutamyltransferase [Ponticaulis sp.]OUX97544.1 MAG: gamma-glutamyltransferase [Hyphomonadaceae bacterium TMED5]|tara:strand:- start:56770 stop:58566 length:1797 start_codon:yes stop_codon:yes gene_type:complete
MARNLALTSALSLALVACQSAPSVSAQTVAAPATPAPVAETPAPAQSVPLLDYQSIHHPVTARNGMVVSQEELASRVGVQILEQGGNAVDAAVAVGFALAVTLPRAGNVAGGGFMMIYDAETDDYISIDYKELAPYAAFRDMYVDENGEVDLDAARREYTASGVPGTVAAFEVALENYGTMSFAEVVAPAVELARNGIEVTYDLAQSLEFAEDKLGSNAAARAIFYHEDGSYYQPGEILVQEDLAWSLEQIGQYGAAAFYEGELAEMIVADQEANGGLITMQDMADYEAELREPLRFDYRGYELVLMPPPSSGGVHIQQMFNVLDEFDLAEMGHNSAATMHIVVEAMRQAYADRSVHLGDPDFYDIPVEWLTSDEYAEETLAAIPADHARSSADVNPGVAPPPESPDTTHYSVWDSEGNVVSNTYSLNYSYGNGAVAAGTGILMNNGMDDFSAQPGQPNGYGLIGGEYNSIEPHKRSLSSMTPAMILQDGKPYVVTGSPGGSRIITTVMQVLMNVIDFDMNIAEATNAPRFHHQWYPDVVFVEPVGFSADTIRAMEAMGYVFEEAGYTMGSTQSIMRQGDFLYGAADPRRPGAMAIGY